MNLRRSAALAAALAVLLLPMAATAVSGFQGPVFKLDTAPNGDILAADAGAGVAVIRDGVLQSTLPAPGAASVAAIGSKSFWVVTGGADPETDSGQALWRMSNGKARMVANLFALEEAENPDGEEVDSNPYDVASLGGDAALVVDAGGNSLWRIDNQGNAELIATFADALLSTSNWNAICVDLGPFGPPCPIPAPAIPGQSVPTSVVVAPDGAYWVGELKGFPAPTGQSSVWRIEPGATGVVCGDDAECVPVLGGFTSIVDLALGPDGKLYVSELDEKSWAAVEIFQSEAVGGTLNACNLSTTVCKVVASGVPEHTAVTFDEAGTPWVTRHALTNPEVIPLG
ncbi:MAG: ScyD/ScyE family protein [Acidimicrobiia bacterium]|nr:ScyD/ScyE family protein [Acidimicrobiia bacterium]